MIIVKFNSRSPDFTPWMLLLSYFYRDYVGSPLNYVHIQTILLQINKYQCIPTKHFIIM